MTAVLPALQQIKSHVEAQHSRPASLDLTGLSLYQALVLYVTHPTYKGHNMVACWALLLCLELKVKLSGVCLVGSLVVTVPVARVATMSLKR